jgi:hypothetical protein
MNLAVRIYGPAKGSRPEQASPDVDEMVGRHGACPHTDTRHSSAGPRVPILRFPSSPVANVNDLKVN